MLTRPLGRPKKRWEDNIRNDTKKLKIKNWSSYMQDRNKWKLYELLRRPERSKNKVAAPEEEEEEEEEEEVGGGGGGERKEGEEEE